MTPHSPRTAPPKLCPAYQGAGGSGSGSGSGGWFAQQRRGGSEGFVLMGLEATGGASFLKYGSNHLR